MVFSSSSGFKAPTRRIRVCFWCWMLDAPKHRYHKCSCLDFNPRKFPGRQSSFRQNLQREILEGKVDRHLCWWAREMFLFSPRGIVAILPLSSDDCGTYIWSDHGIWTRLHRRVMRPSVYAKLCPTRGSASCWSELLNQRSTERSLFTLWESPCLLCKKSKLSPLMKRQVASRLGSDAKNVQSRRSTRSMVCFTALVLFSLV